MSKINNLLLSVGSMKAGTTWLYDKLKLHPDIRFTYEKEIHYFSYIGGIGSQLSYRNRLIKLKKVLENSTSGNIKFLSNKLIEIEWYLRYAKEVNIDNNWYCNLFDGCLDSSYKADFSNLYAHLDKSSWDNVHKLSSNVKIIYTLRDPLKRLWSHYKFHKKFIGERVSVDSKGFDEFKEVIMSEWFLREGLYSRSINTLLNFNKKENVKIMYFESFRNNPQESLNEIFTFLNLHNIIYDDDFLKSSVNQSENLEIPEKWQEFALNSIQAEVKKIKELGYWGKDWGAYY